MPAVKMYIDKFKKEVLIDDDHPLAVAQRNKKTAAPVAVPELETAPAFIQGEGEESS